MVRQKENPKTRQRGQARRPGSPQIIAALPAPITHILFPALLVFVAAFLAIHPVTDPDFWYHTAFGKETLRTGSLPRYDIFSYTAPGHYWISSGWLPSVILHGL